MAAPCFCSHLSTASLHRAGHTGVWRFAVAILKFWGAILKSFIILPLNICFVSEVWWDSGSHFRAGAKLLHGVTSQSSCLPRKLAQSLCPRNNTVTLFKAATRLFGRGCGEKGCIWSSLTLLVAPGSCPWKHREGMHCSVWRLGLG